MALKDTAAKSTIVVVGDLLFFSLHGEGFFFITIFITTCQTACLKCIMRLNFFILFFFKEYTACWESVIEDTLHRPTIIIMP